MRSLICSDAKKDYDLTMKETIYTIPVNEVYEKDCECPLCELERRLEAEAVEYSLGSAMMEPDFRIISNEKGYCRRHFTQMFDSGSKLPLALVLDTHLNEVTKQLDKFKNNTASLKREKKGIFKKSSGGEVADEISKTLEKIENSCVICDKINYTMSRYIDVLLYMYCADNEFKEKFNRSKGVCLKHFKALADTAKKSLKNNDLDTFLASLIEKELTELSRIQEDIHRFTLKFDYRNKDMEWGNAKDAPIRTIEKLAGYIKVSQDEKKN